MIFPTGAVVTFPATVRGRERASLLCGVFPGITARDPKNANVVILKADFELRPLTRPAAAARPLPSFAAAMGAIILLLLLSSPGRAAGVWGPPVTAGGLWPALPLAQTWFPPLNGVGLFLMHTIGVMVLATVVLVFVREARSAFGRKPSLDLEVAKLAEQMRGLAPQQKLDLLLAQFSAWEGRHLPKDEHLGFKEETGKKLDSIWEVIRGLRGAITRIEVSQGEEKAVRTGNGERLRELSTEVRDLSDNVHEMIGTLRSQKGSQG